jgi:tRNA G26 N,N-dimethylase Trm1
MKPVYITRCEHCGKERIGLRPIKTKCTRCDSTVQIVRRIASPAKETLAPAR